MSHAYTPPSLGADNARLPSNLSSQTLVQNLAPSAALVLVMYEQVRIDALSLMPNEIGLAI